jgi:HEAT repeat protein
VLSLRARRDVFDFLPLPEARYLLILDGPRVHTQQWVYARETGTPVASLAADPHDARLEAAMRLLRVLGHTAAAPVVASFATHDAHFVRWTAIRHTMGLDPERGVELLRAALDDPHPHVRNAARKALQRVDGV